MRSIVFCSRKGGSGKTTLAVHMAVAAEASGERVIVIDTDPQASAWAWSQARTEDTPSVEKATVSTLARVMDRAEQNRATLAVIDTAPHAAPGVDTIAAAADFLLIPCRPSAFDIAAIAASVQVAKAAGKPAAFLLNACPSRAPEIEETRDMLNTYGFSVAPVGIADRRAFARAIASGRAVTEFEPQGKAAGEITQLWKWIRQQIGGKHAR